MQNISNFPSDWQDRLPPEVAPTGHLLIPKDVARQVVYYLSNDSAPATGLVIPFDQQTMMQAISNVAGQGLFKSPEYHQKRKQEELVKTSDFVINGNNQRISRL